MRDEFLSEEDLDLANPTDEELRDHWDLWLLQAQATNDQDANGYSHGVFTLLGERDLNLHDLAEERSVAIHRLVAARLSQDPGLVKRALERVEGWLDDGFVHRTYAEAWRELLAGPLETLLDRLVDPSESARALRQCSPFAGVVDPRTRWRMWREVRERMSS